jgi:hypothetical protein
LLTLLEAETEDVGVTDADTLTLAVIDGVRVKEDEAVIDGVRLTLALMLCVALAVTVRVGVVLREAVTEDVPVCNGGRHRRVGRRRGESNTGRGGMLVCAPRSRQGQIYASIKQVRC